MSEETKPSQDDLDYCTEHDFCVACGVELVPYVNDRTCNGCGNGVCARCAVEDDFGNIACTEGCGW